MDAVLQKSMDMTVELTASGKSGRQGCTVATLRADRVSSIPVDHDNKNNNSVVLAGSCHIYLDRLMSMHNTRSGIKKLRMKLCSSSSSSSIFVRAIVIF